MRLRRLGFASIAVMTASFLLFFLMLSGTAVAAENWLNKDSGGFGDTNNMEALSMAVYNSHLYVGTYNDPFWGGQGCEVWRYDGVHWSQVVGQSPPGTPGTGPGFGNPDNYSAYAMSVLGSYLYVGTENDNGCEVWRYDGANWTQVVGQGTAPDPTAPGFGNIDNIGVHSMVSDGSYLYAGTNNDVFDTGEGCEVWCYDGTNWTQVAGQDPPGTIGTGPGFGDFNNGCAHSMAFMGSYLYVGTFNFMGCEVWRYDGASWTQMVGQGTAPDPTAPGFGDFFNATAYSMAFFDGKLYVGTQRYLIGAIQDERSGLDWLPRSGVGHSLNELGKSPEISTMPLGAGCQVWSFDGTNWTPVVGQDPPGTPGTGPGFGDDNNIANSFLTVYNDFLYAGTINIPLLDGTNSVNQAESTGCEVWRFDRYTWTQSNQDGFGNASNVEALCMAPFFGTAFVGTGNFILTPTPILPGSADPGDADLDQAPSSNGSQVWALPYTYYFAEGNTGQDYVEYLSLGNPFDVTAHVNITYLFPDGSTQPQSVDIPPNYRNTIAVNSVVAPNREVSCKLESDIPIVAERPMYFNYKGAWTGGHDTVAADTTSTTWYFAEGYTGPRFEELICVLNPQDQAAALTFRFQTQEEGLKVVSGQTVAAHSRQTFKVNDILGANYQTSLKLESTLPVVAERTMYFDYYGTDDWNWTGGHCVMGTPSLAKAYSFAEGTTRSGFEEWLTLQNPNSEAITINATYQFGPGQGNVVTKSYRVDAERRSTLFVPHEAGTEKDVSVSLSSSANFLAERPMYFRYTASGADWTGGHCVIGSPTTGMEWFFGEGYTVDNFHEWLCLQNPGDTVAVVQIYYYTQEQGPLPARQVEVAARTRESIWVNSNAGAGFQLSARVKVVSGPAIVAERPMYFLYNGAWSGGHDVVGYTP